MSMMAVRSLYCRNHSSHLRRLISSVETYSAAAIESNHPTATAAYSSSFDTALCRRRIEASSHSRSSNSNPNRWPSGRGMASTREGRIEDGAGARHSINSGIMPRRTRIVPPLLLLTQNERHRNIHVALSLSFLSSRRSLGHKDGQSRLIVDA